MPAQDSAPPVLPSAAWYEADIDVFLAADENAILGYLNRYSEFDVETSQQDAWISTLPILKESLRGTTGTLVLEYPIPRMGRRIDAVVITGAVVCALEFKVGSTNFDRTATDQVWDYALDLKNFQEASHSLPIVPILVATSAEHAPVLELVRDPDGVFRPVCCTRDSLRTAIHSAISRNHGPAVDGRAWARSRYHPTPTIVEAARSLYAQHSVAAIACYDAGRQNLALTSTTIERLADHAQASGQKVICFVTGVPGAGKTLVGLNIATRRGEPRSPTHAVFLSGNGPLVAVLREALTRDEFKRSKDRGESARKGKIYEGVKVFIQNVHNFRDTALNESTAPIEHIVIFDEAQRAWNLEQTASFMKRKKNRPDFDMTEPEFLISYLDRHPDWALIVCLVGGGQEINVGEAGIGAWFEACHRRFPNWQLYASSQLTDREYETGTGIEDLRADPQVRFDDSLHLAVSMRSFRAETLSEFVKALLDREEARALKLFGTLATRYPIFICRDLPAAKRWVRRQARGTERFGLVASSKAQRLKPYAIDVRVNVDPVHWFLDERDDTRSSYYLEDAATEFQVQGLELDWTCVTWDGDLRAKGNSWSYHKFRGDRWVNVNDADLRTYLLNAYRVLLTRARQGMVLFIPRGESQDATRDPQYYDPTFDYLRRLGIPELAAE